MSDGLRFSWSFGLQTSAVRTPGFHWLKLMPSPDHTSSDDIKWRGVCNQGSHFHVKGCGQEGLAVRTYSDLDLIDRVPSARLL